MRRTWTEVRGYRVEEVEVNEEAISEGVAVRRTESHTG